MCVYVVFVLCCDVMLCCVNYICCFEEPPSGDITRYFWYEIP